MPSEIQFWGRGRVLSIMAGKERNRILNPTRQSGSREITLHTERKLKEQEVGSGYKTSRPAPNNRLPLARLYHQKLLQFLKQ